MNKEKNSALAGYFPSSPNLTNSYATTRKAYLPSELEDEDEFFSRWGDYTYQRITSTLHIEETHLNKCKRI